MCPEMMPATIVLPLGDRFWSKVDKTGDCWEWIAGKDPRGYGRISFTSGGRSVPHLAHRCSYLEHFGYLPNVVDHICRNTSCVNPKHLREATQKQNAENTSSKRSNNTSGYRGVGWVKRKNKWRAYVKHNYKSIHVGLFDTAEDANIAVVAARKRLFTHNEEDTKEKK